MCSIIYNLSDYHILVCPITKTSFNYNNTPNSSLNVSIENTTIKNTTTAQPTLIGNTTTAQPTLIGNTTTAQPTLIGNTTTAQPTLIENTTTESTTTAQPTTTESTTTAQPTLIENTTTESTTTAQPLCTPCVCNHVNVPSPSPSPISSPSPSLNMTVNMTVNMTNHTHRPGLGSSQVQDLSGLHALWALIPVLAILCYGGMRKKLCSRMRVGFLKERYKRRSKSWPSPERSDHPARIPRSKSTNFDSIVL